MMSVFWLHDVSVLVARCLFSGSMMSVFWLHDVSVLVARCLFSGSTMSLFWLHDVYFHEFCLTGWEGAECDVFSDDCVGNNCTNDATCKDGHRRFTCICVPGFTGTLCFHSDFNFLRMPKGYKRGKTYYL